MIRVMIVDDEPFIRQGLKILINWQQLGFEIAGEAADGVEALELLGKQDFNLIITDIKMPRMTGVELIEYIRKNISKDIHFMILSGFYEYEYAKVAIRFGVEDYILKPVQKSELIKQLEEYKEKFYADIENKKKMELSDKLVLDSYISHLISGIRTDKELEYIYNYLPAATSVRYIGLEYDQADKNYRNLTDDDKVRLQTLLYNALQEYLNEYQNRVYMEADRSISDYMVGFIYTEKMAVSAACSEKDFFFNLMSEISRKLSKKVILYIGQEVADISELSDSYKSAIIARNFQRFSNENDITFYDELKYSDSSERQLLYTDVMDSLIRAIEENDENSIRNRTDEVYRYFRDWAADENIIKINLDYLLVNLIGIIKRLKPDFDKKTVYHMIGLGGREKGTIRGSIAHIMEFSMEFANYINQLRQNSCCGVLCDIEQEIVRNYAENLSLKTLSKKYYLNSAYLGQIFKKKYGVPFNDYLNNYRIDRAAELLLRSDKKVYLIAEEVGFNNADYFVNKFVKNKGITPLQYRKQIIDNVKNTDGV